MHGENSECKNEHMMNNKLPKSKDPDTGLSSDF